MIYVRFEMIFEIVTTAVKIGIDGLQRLGMG